MADDKTTEGLPPGFGDDRDRSWPTAPPVLANHRVLGKLGEGGFGEVWLAEQLKPIKRRVALKVIKPGMDSRQVIARFETERQALALMDHPAIAKVYDAGATGGGHPYFVMEYVPGVPITEYADRNRLDTEARLELFVRVCEGVQHAHQKAVIHRDIKPSNVLVYEQDGEPQPKIIDFGVAKATAQRLTERTLFTQLGQFVGTPEYMSPEQAEATGEDVDTRSDVYSLGVLLYELLVGALPIDPRQIRQAGMDEVRRKIREDDPPRPSTRISTLGDDSQAAAQNRRTNPPTLMRLLSGDLDWIVMKALEKERDRRYGSPSDLAGDIARHLRDEPITARPPGTGYRLRKFVRRHRLAVAAASVTAAALFAGLTLATYGLLRATRAEEQARQEAHAASLVAEFMVDLFEGPDPGEARGNSVTAREILDRGVERIRGSLADQPETRAMMMETMGRVYRALGLYDEARPLLEQAVEIRDSGDPRERLTLASALDELGQVHLWQGDYENAEALARRALAIREELLGREHPDVAASLNTLGNALQNNGRLEEAERVHRRAVSIREQASGSNRAELAKSLHNLAIVRFSLNDFAEAEALYKRSAEIEEKIGGTDNHDLATSLHTLAILYQNQARYDEAIPLEQRSLAIREKVLGPRHPHVAYSLTTLGNLLRVEDRAAEAEPLLRRAVSIGEEAWSAIYPEVRWMRRSLAQSLADQGKHREAETELLALLHECEADADENSLPPTLNALGSLFAEQERFEEAERHFRRSLEIDERLSGSDDPYLAPGLRGLANVYRDQERYDEAAPLYERALQLLEGAVDPNDPDRLSLAQDYDECRRLSARGG